IAPTIGGVARAAPTPMSPLSVSTRIKVASLLTLVPRSVRWRFSSGTGADIGIADTLTIFMGCSSPSFPRSGYQEIVDHLGRPCASFEASLSEAPQDEAISQCRERFTLC